MTDRPIIFSAPMVRALLDGRKTQMRRLAWRPSPAVATPPRGTMASRSDGSTVWQRAKPGDRLWVREAWCSADADDSGPYAAAYMADHPGDPRGLGWRPSIHMPRWASRITLTVTAVRRQRLQDITRGDARAEGVPRLHPIADDDPSTPIDAFGDLWDALHGEGAWAANPEVVALTFTVERRNIDAKEAA